MCADLQKTREDHTGGFLSHFAIVDITNLNGGLKSTMTTCNSFDTASPYKYLYKINQHVTDILRVQLDRIIPVLSKHNIRRI